MAQQEIQNNRSIPAGTLYISAENLQLVKNDINNVLRNAWEKGVLVEGKLNRKSDFVETVLDVLFPNFEGVVSRRYYISLNSRNLNPNNDTSVKVLIRPKNGPRLAAMFPQNEIPVAMGTIVNLASPQGGVLYLDKIQLINMSDKRNFENPIDVHVTRDISNMTNNVLTTANFSQFNSISKIAEDEFQEWYAYLNWRWEQVINNIRGIRYENLSYNQTTGKWTMTIVSKNDSVLKRLTRKDDFLAICPCGYSDDINNWKPNNKLKSEPNNFPGVSIDNFKPLSDIVKGTGDEAEYYLRRCEFEIPGNNRANKVSSEEFKNGFIFESISGDLALYQRMNEILNKIQNGKLNACPFLTSYLFDAKQAQLPRKLEELEFINTKLNDAQKEAVQKMVSAPEIAFIQGPPGTGKTTVIAEAVHQFVKRKQRVLISSQSIAAVDNALERLNIDTDLAQPIRIKKFSSSEQSCKYDEQHAISTWYKTLAAPSIKRLESWDSQQNRIDVLKRISNSLTGINNQISNNSAKIEQIKTQLAQNSVELQELKNKVDSINSRDNSAKNAFLFLDYILNGDNMRATFSVSSISEDAIHIIEENIIPHFNALKSQGCYPFIDYSRNVEPTEAVVAFQRCIKKWQDILYNEAQLADLVERLTLQRGEEILGVESTIELRQIEEEIIQIDEQLDNADDDTYEKLRQKRKELSARKNSIKSDGCLPESLIQRIFNVRNHNQDDVAAYLLQTERTRSEALPILSAALDEIRRTKSEMEGVVTQCKEQIAQFSGKSESDAQTLETYQQSQHQQNMLVDSCSRFEDAIIELNKQVAALRLEYSQTVQCELNNVYQIPTQFAEQVNETLSSLSEKWDSFKSLTDEIAPISRKWVEMLSKCSESDSPVLIQQYEQNCNVVGITCTENNNSLSNINMNTFDVVIIDEVSKATPPELLIPMSHGKKVILIGDHRQLPPNFDVKNTSDAEECSQSYSDSRNMYQSNRFNLSPEQKAMKINMEKYRNLVENSLFKRGFENADNSIKSSLWLQFRMHPDIMNIINQFYDDKLKCGINNAEQSRNHGLNLPYILPQDHVVWIDSSNTLAGKPNLEQMSGYSFTNDFEAELILQALSDIDKNLVKSAAEGQIVPQKTVGIITFYMGQLRLLQRKLHEYRQKNGEYKYLKIKASTVDRFQGQECDYVFVSMVRNSKKLPQYRFAFIKRFERVNVAFSRAKELLVIVGASSFFRKIDVEIPSINGDYNTNERIYNKIYEHLRQYDEVINPKMVINTPKLNAFDNQNKFIKN